MKRSPVEFVFGKDIASIIHRYVWMQAIKTVNDEYLQTYIVREQATIFFIYNQTHRRSYNYRRQEGSLRRFIYNKNTRDRVADLPKNYFQIKELY